jgi:hypothetical protein
MDLARMTVEDLRELQKRITAALVQAQHHRIADLRTLTEQGLTAAEIAERLGCSVGAIKMARSRHGIVPIARASRVTADVVRAAQADGRSSADLARELGLARESVAKAAREMGLPFPRRPVGGPHKAWSSRRNASPTPTKRAAAGSVPAAVVSADVCPACQRDSGHDPTCPDRPRVASLVRPARPASSVPVVATVEDVLTHPFLTPDRVAALLRCTCWADLATLAAQWGKPMAMLQGWFLRHGGQMAVVRRRDVREAAE